MPTVTVEGEKSFEVETGKKLVLAIEDAGIDILHRCGGNVRCTTCRVQMQAGDAPPMRPTEQERLARETNLEPNTRLSCQIRVESDLWVVVVNRSTVAGVDWTSPAGLTRLWASSWRVTRRALADPRSFTSRLRALLAAHGPAANLRAASRAAVELCLPHLLLTRTKWHCTPQITVKRYFDSRTAPGRPPYITEFGMRRHRAHRVYSITPDPGQGSIDVDRRLARPERVGSFRSGPAGSSGPSHPAGRGGTGPRLASRHVETVHVGAGECDVRGRQVAARITAQQLAFGTDDLDLAHPVMGNVEVPLGIEADPVGLIADLAGALLREVDQERGIRRACRPRRWGTPGSGCVYSRPPPVPYRRDGSRSRWETPIAGRPCGRRLDGQGNESCHRRSCVGLAGVGEVNAAGSNVQRQVVGHAGVGRLTRSRPA